MDVSYITLPQKLDPKLAKLTFIRVRCTIVHSSVIAAMADYIEQLGDD